MTINQNPEGTPVDANAVVVPAKKSKLRRNLLIAGSVISIAALGSTFAANISLNGGNNVEFGQGVTATTACDSQITITPYSTFTNSVGAGSSKLTSIKLSGIDSSPGHCAGKVFEIKVYGDNGILNILNFNESDFYTDPPTVFQDTNYDFVEITNTAGLFSWTSGGTDGDDITNDDNAYDPGRDLTNTSFTLSLTSRNSTITRTPLASTEDVKAITVQTRDPN